MHGRGASLLVESSASEVHLELLEATALVERLGRGVVYFGRCVCARACVCVCARV